MKFAILIEDYNLFYTRSLENDTVLNAKLYKEKLDYLLDKKYYQADSLAQALIKLGHEAEVIIPTCNPLQLSWAKENNKLLRFKWYLQKPVRSFKSRFLNRYNTFNSIREKILLKQLQIIKPNVVFVYSNIWIGNATLEKVKLLCNKLILQWSCPIDEDWKGFSFNKFDFIVSSSKSIVDYFKNRNIVSYYWQQAFDADILEKLVGKPQIIKDIVFIGNFTPYHMYRYEVIEHLLQNGINIDVYGSGKDNLPVNSLLKDRIMPPLNGLKMFKKYKEYKLALHIYGESKEKDGIDWASFAGAKRNFEITGIGTALLTSYQGNLPELFELEKEIITFKTKEDCLKKIQYYLLNTNELSSVAITGQQKTLQYHTFGNRAEALLNLIKI